MSSFDSNNACIILGLFLTLLFVTQCEPAKSTSVCEPDAMQTQETIDWFIDTNESVPMFRTDI